MLTVAYGRRYLDAYRRLAAEFDRRPRGHIASIWQEAAAELDATIKGSWETGFDVGRRGVRGRIWEWNTHLDSPAAIARADDKAFVADLVASLGSAVPEQLGFSLRQIGSALERVREHPGRWVVKPRSGAGGMGVTCGIERSPDVLRAAVAAATVQDELILERQVEGPVYRLLFLDGELLDVVRRDPSAVTGDGDSTIAELVSRENHARFEAGGARGNQLVRPDHDLLFALRSRGLKLETIPPEGVQTRVKHSNGDGGRFDTHSVASSTLPPQLVAAATNAVAALDLHLAGVDLVAPGPGAPTPGAILEINAPPALHYHYVTADGPSDARVATRVLDRVLSA